MRKLQIISVTALAMSLAMPAYAQNAPETEEEASDEIIVTATLRAMVDQALVDLEVRELRSKTRELGADTVGKKMADMARAGRKPSADGSQFFWQMVLSWCAKNSDAALAQRAFDELSGQKAPPQMIERNRALLEQAKSGGK